MIRLLPDQCQMQQLQQQATRTDLAGAVYIGCYCFPHMRLLVLRAISSASQSAQPANLVAACGDLPKP
jgi:hypothetical protein